jgi:hypothetical protein
MAHARERQHAAQYVVLVEEVMLQRGTDVADQYQ